MTDLLPVMETIQSKQLATLTTDQFSKTHPSAQLPYISELFRSKIVSVRGFAKLVVNIRSTG